MRYPEISGWQRGQVTSRIWQRYVVGSSADPADWPTRLYGLDPLFITRPYKSTAWAAACRVRFTREEAVGGTQPIRGGPLGPVCTEVTDLPRAHTIRARGTPPA